MSLRSPVPSQAKTDKLRSFIGVDACLGFPDTNESIDHRNAGTS